MQPSAQTNAIPEGIFRLTVALLVLLLVLVRRRFGKHYSPPDALKRLWTDKVDLLLIVPCFLGMMFSVCCYMLKPQFLSFAQIVVSLWLRWTGLPLSLAALGLMNWSDRLLDRNFSVAIELQEDHRLITSGPYRVIRHPIYAAVILLGVSLSLLSANGVVFFCWCIWTIPVFAYRMHREERLLEEHFGPQYQNYRQSTRRVIPGIW